MDVVPFVRTAQLRESRHVATDSSIQCKEIDAFELVRLYGISHLMRAANRCFNRYICSPHVHCVHAGDSSCKQTHLQKDNTSIAFFASEIWNWKATFKSSWLRNDREKKKSNASGVRYSRAHALNVHTRPLITQFDGCRRGTTAFKAKVKLEILWTRKRRLFNLFSVKRDYYGCSHRCPVTFEWVNALPIQSMDIALNGRHTWIL